MRKPSSQFRTEIEATYAELVNALVESGWITAAERVNLRPKIDVKLHDLREDKAWPLR